VKVGDPLHPEDEDWAAALTLRDRATSFISNATGEPPLTDGA